MKWIICSISALVGFFSWNIESFEVKVLLQKRSCVELAQDPFVIRSTHGVIVSSNPTLCIGAVHAQKECIVSIAEQKLTVNNRQELLPIYISPDLSAQHQAYLKKSVEQWFDNNRTDLYKNCEELQPFFDAFIEKKSVVSPQSYESLTDYTKDIFVGFFSKMIDNFGDQVSVISMQTLESHIDVFLKNKIKETFLTHLVVRQLSKQEKKLLQTDQSFRFDFFSHHVYVVAQELLQEFLLMLPRNFLSQILNEDAGYLTINGNNYLGNFALVRDEDFVYLVNCLDIDDYLLSVIYHEGWPGWPLEMNKVLAIACRTYLVWQVLQAQKANRPYHIEDNIRHQSYKGHHKEIQLKKAVFDTRDICIGYENKPILAMFDSCCGGVIPAYIDQDGYKKHPYLLRKTPCSFCKGCKIATWKSVFTHDALLAIIKKAIPEITSIDDIQVTKKDSAELVKKVSIWSKGKCYHVTGKKMYSLFPEIKSFCFEIDSGSKKTPVSRSGSKHRSKIQKKTKPELSKSDKRFIISGKGYGHHVGLCQWGAVSMVKNHHWNYQKVLQFYYPGTNLIKLTYQR